MYEKIMHIITVEIPPAGVYFNKLIIGNLLLGSRILNVGGNHGKGT
jgi:hypothetical protein